MNASTRRDVCDNALGEVLDDVGDMFTSDFRVEDESKVIVVEEVVILQRCFNIEVQVLSGSGPVTLTWGLNCR